ncbi:MAG: hypothetical protein M1816_005164 [Peltula sp. TS41687]|nr:MAG: hypothetical protein M1816_005164 [Peltula sp. TS41687]
MPPLKVHFEDSDESDFIDPVSPKDEPGDEDTTMVIYEDKDDEGSTPGNTTASSSTASPSKKTTGKTVKRRVTKAEREAAKFQSSLDKAAALEKPDWDGVHGRLCNLLPEHAQFRFNATVDRTPLPFDLENSFPIKPIKGIRQVETMETRVAFWAFDTGVGVFPPELKYRNQINMDDITGGDSTDPIESNTPFGRGYCGNCPCSKCRQFRVDAGKVDGAMQRPDGAMERPDGARDSLLAEANEAAAEGNHQGTETVGMDQDAMME